MRFLFAYIFVASLQGKFLIAKHFLHLCHGEKSPFVQIGERNRTAVGFAEIRPVQAL